MYSHHNINYEACC